MKKALSILTTLAVATAIIGGCSTKADEDSKTGANIAALTATDGDGNDYCVAGTIEIWADNNNNGTIEASDDLVSTVATDCGDPSHEVILLPDDYLVRIPDAVCTSDLDGLEDCVQVPNPTPFSVSVSVVTPVALQYVFSYENDEDHNVLFGVGSANITLVPPENQERCGEGLGAPICGPDQVCADVDGTGLACYDNCSTNLGAGGGGGAPPVPLTCAPDETCTATGVQTIDQRATNPAALPPPLVIGDEGALADTLWLCVPNAAAGGAGGGGGAAG